MSVETQTGKPSPNPVLEIKQLWEQFKERLEQSDQEVKRYGQESGELKATIEKMSARLDELELQQKRVPPITGNTEQSKGLFDSLLSSKKVWANYLGKAEEDVRESDVPYAEKAYDAYIRHGSIPAELRKAFAEEVKATANTGDDIQGGFLVPPTYQARIIETLIELSPVRNEITMLNVTGNEIMMPVRKSVIPAKWVGESEDVGDPQALEWGLETLRLRKMGAYVRVTNEMLQDAAIDIEGYIRRHVTEQFSLAEGQAFLYGSGNKQPEGILVNPNVAVDYTGDATKLTYDGLVDVSHNIKTQYHRNGRFYFSLKTLGVIRKIKDDQKNPIFAPATAGAPATVLGMPYTLWPDMPDVVANSTPVLFGDLGAAYTAIQKLSMSVIRDNITRKAYDEVELVMYLRVYGQVTLAEAVRKLKVAVAP